MSKITPFAAALVVAVSGSVLASEHVAEVEQIGTNNRAEQMQSGVMLRSYVLQNGAENRALTDQAGTSGEGGQADIEQVGTLNVAEIYQVYGTRPDTASAAIYQVGTSNIAVLEQHERRDEFLATATVHQEGTGNRLNATQGWVQNTLNVVSIGQNNVVDVIQTGFSTLQVQQTGTANQLKYENTTNYANAFAAVHQVGTANQADIAQYSGRYPAGEVYLEQIGTANVAKISSSSYATVDYIQQGTGNALDSYISGGPSSLVGSSEGDYNSVLASQFGDRNSLDIAQTGSFNQIEAYQELRSHGALITQAGDANQAFLMQGQSPTGHIASIVQSGNGNVANVLQQ